MAIDGCRGGAFVDDASTVLASPPPPPLCSSSAKSSALVAERTAAVVAGVEPDAWRASTAAESGEAMRRSF